MQWFLNAAAGLRSLLRRERKEREMDDELHAFLDNSIESKMKTGMTASEAARAARIEMGSANAIKHRIRSAAWETELENFLHDIRYGLRVLARSPGFTLVAVLSLALGIGANTAIFTLINGLLLKELPVRAPLQLVSFGKAFGGGIVDSTNLGEGDLFPYLFARQLQTNPGPFAGICSFASFTLKLGVRAGEPQTGPAPQVMTHLVSGNYFNVLGAEMELGRPLEPSDEESPGRNAVVVVSDRYWRAALGADRNAIGRAITVSGAPFTIVGVAPRSFFGIKLQADPPDIWAPLTMQREVLMRSSLLGEGGLAWLHMAGRRDATHSLIQDQEWVNAQMRNTMLAKEGARLTPERRSEIGRLVVKLVSARTGISDLRTIYGDSVRVLMAVVVLVLLVACANLANLLLAKAATRQREIATRLALGSSRMRIVRQVLIEALLLSLAGGALGLGLAFAAARVLIRFVAAGSAHPTLDARPDLRVLLFTLAVSLLTGLVFGIAPALRLSRSSALPAMNRSVRTASAGGGHAASRILVAAQVALCVVLLAGSGLFLRTLINLQHQDLGFDRTHLLLVEFGGNFGGVYKPEQLPGLYQSIANRVSALPGAGSAAFSGDPPLSHGIWDSPISIRGYNAQPKEDTTVFIDQVTPRYFETLGVRLLEGRGIEPQDVRGAPHTMVVNRTFAAHFFPHGGAIGHRVTFDDPSIPGEWEIVGVAADAKYNDQRETAQWMIYLPVLQLSGGNAYARWLQVRTAGDPAQSVQAVRAALAETAPNLPILNLLTVRQQLGTFTANETIISELSSLFSTLTVVLAGIGLYGVMGFSVHRRTGEIGIRMALGAQRSQVRWMILRESLALVAIGLAFGLPAAWATGRLVQSQLFGLNSFDPLTLSAAVILVAAVTLAAAWLPARRATQVEPLVALRCE